MNGAYEAAFRGYESYYGELQRLGTQPNPSFLTSAEQRLKSLATWFETSLPQSDSEDELAGRFSKKTSFGILTLGMVSLFHGAVNDNLVLSSTGCFLVAVGGRDYYASLRSSSKPTETVLPPETQRYMYAKFMLDSVAHRRDQ